MTWNSTPLRCSETSSMHSAPSSSPSLLFPMQETVLLLVRPQVSLSFCYCSMNPSKAHPYFIRKVSQLNPPTSGVLKVWPILSTVLITLWFSVQVAQVQVPRVWHKVAQVQEGSAEIFPRRLLLNSVAPGFPSWLLVFRAALRPHSKSHIVW